MEYYIRFDPNDKKPWWVVDYDGNYHGAYREHSEAVERWTRLVNESIRSQRSREVDEAGRADTERTGYPRDERE